MNMKETLRTGILEATRLVNAGGLREATAKIQRTLRGILSSDAPADIPSAGADAPIEGTFRVIDAHSPSAGAETNVPPAGASRPFARYRAPLHPQPRGDSGQRPRPTPPSDLARDVEPGGQFISRSYTNQAGTRTYKLYIPSGYQGKPLPLIVMLHGCTQSPDDFAAGTRMNRLAEEHQCLVVYPAQARAANQSNCWNWFNTADQHRDRGEPCIIAGITLEIISGYAIDTHRVYVAGLSAGGAMAAVMATTYPDLYAAIGIHSGLPYAVAHDLPSAFAAMHQGAPSPGNDRRDRTSGAGSSPRAVPTIVFHGDRDTTVHPRNGDHVIAQCMSVHAPNGSDIKAATNPPVTVQRGQVPDGHAYTRTSYHDPSGQIMLEQWEVHGAGHAWSGGSLGGSYTDPKGPDATNEMIRFFYEHPHPEPAGKSLTACTSSPMTSH